MNKIMGLSVAVFSIWLFGNCKGEKVYSGGLPGYEIKRLERLELEAEVISNILQHDDSSFHLKPTWTWRHFRAAQQWDQGIPLGYDSSGKHIYIGIIDRYFPARNLGDSSFLDLNLSRYGVEKSLIDAYMENMDRSGLEMPLHIKHRHVFVREEDYKKPHFSLRDIHKKYVSNFCVVRFSRPTFSDDKTECLTFYENLWVDKSGVYYSRLENGKWKVIAVASTLPQDRGIP